MSTPTDGVLLAEMLAARTLVEVALLRYPLDEALRRLAPKQARADTTIEELDRIDRLAADVLRNRRWPKNTCLQRAMTRFVLYRRRGVDVCFAMGVRPGAGPLTGHAWLEREGTPFREVRAVDCTRTFSFPDPE